MQTFLFPVALLLMFFGISPVCRSQSAQAEKVYDYTVELQVQLDTSATNRLIVLLDTNGIRVSTTQHQFEQHLNMWQPNHKGQEDRALFDRILSDTLHNRVVNAGAIALLSGNEKRFAYQMASLIDNHFCVVTNTQTQTNYPEIRVQRYVGNSGGRRYFGDTVLFLSVTDWSRQSK
jgi:hypothetical protein